MRWKRDRGEAIEKYLDRLFEEIQEERNKLLRSMQSFNESNGEK